MRAWKIQAANPPDDFRLSFAGDIMRAFGVAIEGHEDRDADSDPGKQDKRESTKGTFKD